MQKLIKIRFKKLLNIKEKQRKSQAFLLPVATFGPRHTAAQALPHAQAATWAWAGNSAALRLPPGPIAACSVAGRPCPLDQIRRLGVASGGAKPASDRLPQNPRAISLPPFLSLSRISQSSGGHEWPEEERRSRCRPPRLAHALTRVRTRRHLAT